MRRKIADSVVVITGASSGIGRATALEFARQGATIVLAARREHALHDVARDCEAEGGRALVAPTDVTDQHQVEALAKTAIENFGRIDVWVNNAAVTLFGRFEETPLDDFRRVVETNLFGYVYGARAALPYMREQGSGVLINVSSVVSDMPQPYTSAYVAAKYAIRGFLECLRMELQLDGAADIHICHLMPASIDTPLFQQAANFTGRAVKALDPVYPPEQVAEAIVRMARRPKRELIVGAAGRVATSVKRIAPGLFERYGAHQIDKHHLQPQPTAPTHGNLYDPMPQYARIHGGWGSSAPPASSGGRWAMLGIAAAVPALLYLAARRQCLPEAAAARLRSIGVG